MHICNGLPPPEKLTLIVRLFTASVIKENRPQFFSDLEKLLAIICADFGGFH
jgi:hypothetical protein